MTIIQARAEYLQAKTEYDEASIRVIKREEALGRVPMADDPKFHSWIDQSDIIWTEEGIHDKRSRYIKAEKTLIESFRQVLEQAAPRQYATMREQLAEVFECYREFPDINDKLVKMALAWSA
ncbi:MAG: hypothetical protein M0Z41_13930 [Peptococcaceae bacterium]|jgi:hypothetical protein|nr:hypothetical protein [Peptococcaceae bacterium]